ncbi:MAG: 50S ribosomal protein L9 [Patescibacteria group bacterium]
MRVILLQNIKGVGQIGDVKDVNDGYGRNFLLARNLAKPATTTALKQAEELRSKREVIMKEQKNKAREVADRIKDVTLELKEKTNEKGKLFAAVGKKEISHKFKEKTGVHLEDDMIQLDEHIKTVGEHTVQLELAPEVIVPLKIIITEA